MDSRIAWLLSPYEPSSLDYGSWWAAQAQAPVFAAISALNDAQAELLRDPPALSPFHNVLTPLGTDIQRLRVSGFLRCEWQGGADQPVIHYRTAAGDAALERYRIAKLAEIGVHEIAA
jgi:hypothetical protein